MHSDDVPFKRRCLAGRFQITRSVQKLDTDIAQIVDATEKVAMLEREVALLKQTAASQADVRALVEDFTQEKDMLETAFAAHKRDVYTQQQDVFSKLSQLERSLATRE